MNKYVIIPDTSCDLTADLRERFDFPDYLRGVITFPDGHSERINLDWETISPTEFYESMKDKKSQYKTSAVNPDETLEIFEKYLSMGYDVLSLSLSSALSSTYNVCLQAAKLALEKYPDRKIICIDSLRYSTSLALLAVLAGQKKQEGLSLEEVAEWVENNKHCIHQMGPMDDLFFLCKTGRISNFKAFFGTLVGVNPMADFNRNGMSEVLIKCKGKQNAFDTTIKYMKRTGIDLDKQLIFIAHSNRYQQALRLKEMIEQEINPAEIIITNVGMACGASIGPGLCAAFYFGKPISENNVEEKAIMKELEEQLKAKKK
ncbi:MAG: DegV family protein [Ruminococcaceae bacterium]|nr:DegV family protein [Oscillospiraceae bacterium]